MTELEVNGIVLLDTEDSVAVNMSSALQVDINNVVVWSRTADLPDPITDFVASDNLYYSIHCTWTTGIDTLSTDLYVDGLGVVAVGITSPYDWDAPADDTNYTMGIVSRGEEGDILSNTYVGKVIPVPPTGDVIIDYNGISGSNPETVSGSSGSFTFTVPENTTSINYCIAGGGASGGWPQNYGGTAGEILSGAIDVTTLPTVSITIGRGGAASIDVSNAGTSSSINGTSVAGGNSDYRGDGASKTSCGGTFNDGSRYSDGTISYGGEAGGFGNGGNGGSGNGGAGGVGAGGGGTRSESNSRGAGGNGRVVITWGITV